MISLDSNLLLYAFALSLPEHARARGFLRNGQREGFWGSRICARLESARGANLKGKSVAGLIP